MGVIVIGERGDGQTRDDRNIARVLESDSDLLLDNGADLIGETLRSGGSSRLLGATEETTTGGLRLRERATPPGFPVIVINDSPLKLLVENEFGVGQSLVQGFMNATNLMLPAATATVVGYGPCGRGVATTRTRSPPAPSRISAMPIPAAGTPAPPRPPSQCAGMPRPGAEQHSVQSEHDAADRLQRDEESPRVGHLGQRGILNEYRHAA
jgi:hypothetical protein